MEIITNAPQDDGPFLIRNYDLDPALNEATLLRLQWRAKSVLGMVEGLNGRPDAINVDGLAVSLSFGGRVTAGKGFRIPMIIRNLLEIYSDVQQAIEALRYTPTHMSYNVTMVDPSNDIATVMVSPDRPAIVMRRPRATNHQIGIEWPGNYPYEQVCRSRCADEYHDARQSAGNGRAAGRTDVSVPLGGNGCLQ